MAIPGGANSAPLADCMMFNRTELVMPPAITLEMVKGFTLYFHALHGEGGDERPGDEVIDLARSNLWR